AATRGEVESHDSLCGGTGCVKFGAILRKPDANGGSQTVIRWRDGLRSGCAGGVADEQEARCKIKHGGIVTAGGESHQGAGAGRDQTAIFAIHAEEPHGTTGDAEKIDAVIADGKIGGGG